MNKFSDFKITTKLQNFVGDKIKVSRVLNKEIEIIDYRIEPSKFEGNRLFMQITIDGEKRVVFTGSKFLQQMIEEVPKNKFPFTATIIEDNERYEFR